MMGTPVSATPESRGWSALADNALYSHISANSSPLVLTKPPISSPANLVNHSTPQRIQVPTPKSAIGGITPSQYFERKLRTAVLSPYQKSYTPLSATPSGVSPAFKTPIRVANSASAYSPNPMRTPVGTKIPTSCSKFITPQSGPHNPFEDALFDRYRGSVLSPGIFALSDTPGTDRKSEKAFRWSIDQLAVLHPADIDEMPNQETFRARLDREVEERAQHAINEFFSRHNILPSPMNSTNGKPAYLVTPIFENGLQTEEVQRSVQKDLPRKKKTQEASCQTVLTLPMNFDLQKVLGEFMTYNEEEDNNQEALSTSTLRRKLFFHGDTSVSPSPVKSADVDMQCDDASPPLSPLQPATTPQWHRLSRDSSPACFSSSPINVNKDAGLCLRMSADMDCLQSPELSPIKIKQTPVHKDPDESNPSLGLCGSLMSSPMVSKLGPWPTNLLQRMAMASPDMSPICPRSKTTVFGIPDDMSPIHSPVQEERKLSPIHQVEVTDSHHNFSPPSNVQFQGLSSALSTPSTVGTSVSDSCVHVTTLTTTATTPVVGRDILAVHPQHIGGHFLHVINEVPESTTAYQERQQLSMSDISMDATGMETEYAAHSTGIPLGTNTRDPMERNFSLSSCRDCSMTYAELTNQGPVPTSQYSQDTGYQTCSLQLTNQDAGLHTNLTSHFGSLPFKNDIEPNGGMKDEAFEDGNLENLKQERIFPRPIIFKEKLDCVNLNFVNRQLNYNDLPKPVLAEEKIGVLAATRSDMKVGLEGCQLLPDGLSEEQVIAKARLLLGQNHSLNCSNSDGQVGYAFAQSQCAKSQPPGSGQMLPWQPSCSSTPQKSQQNMYAHLLQKYEPRPPSEVALAVLKRAGDDLAMFGHM